MPYEPAPNRCKRWTEEQKETLRRMWKARANSHEIAKAIGKGAHTLRRKAAALGLERRPQGGWPEYRNRTSGVFGKESRATLRDELRRR